jgi:hypothetical protein
LTTALQKALSETAGSFSTDSARLLRSPEATIAFLRGNVFAARQYSALKNQNLRMWTAQVNENLAKDRVYQYRSATLRVPDQAGISIDHHGKMIQAIRKKDVETQKQLNLARVFRCPFDGPSDSTMQGTHASSIFHGTAPKSPCGASTFIPVLPS